MPRTSAQPDPLTPARDDHKEATLPCATHEQIDETVEVLRASAFAMARDLYPGRPDTLLLAMADLLLRRAIAKLPNR